MAHDECTHHPVGRNGKRAKIPTCGHPDRKHFGRGRCYACYVVWLRESGEGKRRGDGWRLANKDKHLAQARARAAKQRARPGYREMLRARSLKYNFGITVAEYDAMAAAQDGACAICRKPERIRQKYGKTRRLVVKRLCVDHDHKTGKIRGLLCQRCNQMIGHGADDVSLLKAAIKYLETG